ncbi:MAG: T9SS type A sorting domain-containing protein, partial [Chitinophagaceae bacterium]
GLSPAGNATLTNPVPADSVQVHGRTWYHYLSDSTYRATTAGSYPVPVRYAFPLLESAGQGSTLDTLIITPGIATSITGPLDAASSVTLIPNPARSKVHVVYSGRQGTMLTATLLSPLGTILRRPVAFSGNTATLDLNGLAPGVYILVISDTRSGRRLQKQVVKL